MTKRLAVLDDRILCPRPGVTCVLARPGHRLCLGSHRIMLIGANLTGLDLPIKLFKEIAHIIILFNQFPDFCNNIIYIYLIVCLYSQTVTEKLVHISDLTEN